MAVSLIARLSSACKYNTFFRFLRRYAMIQTSSAYNCLSPIRFYSGESEGNVDKEEDERIAPLMRIGFSREESTEYLHKSKDLERGGNRNMTLRRMEENIAFLNEVHFKNSDIKQIFKKKSLFRYSPKRERFTSALRFLHEELVFNSEEVRKMVTTQPEIVTVKSEHLSYANKVVPRYLEMSSDDFRSLLVKDPRLLLANPNNFEEVVKLSKESKVTLKTFINWVYYLGKWPSFSAEEGMRTIQLLRSFGFEDYDVRDVFQRIGFFIASLREETAKMNLAFLEAALGLSNLELKRLVVKQPSLLVISTGVLKHSTEYLMKTVGLSKEDILNYHYVLKYRTKRIEARYEFARMCGLTGKSPGVIVIYHDAKFAKLCGRTTEEYRAFYDSNKRKSAVSRSTSFSKSPYIS